MGLIPEKQLSGLQTHSDSIAMAASVRDLSDCVMVFLRA